MRILSYKEGKFYEVRRTGFKEVTCEEVDVTLLDGYRWTSSTGEETLLILIECDKYPEVETCVLTTDNSGVEKELGLIGLSKVERLGPYPFDIHELNS